jgi:voltage-gated potassium channel
MKERKKFSPKQKGTRSFEDRARRTGLSRSEYIIAKARNNTQRFFNTTACNVIVAFLILVNVTLIFMEFMVPDGALRERIYSVNDSFTWIFIVELSLRYIVAPNKKIYISNYWLDILSVLPALRIFRTIRVFRLFRLLRLARAAMILMTRSGWLSKRFEKYFGSFGILLLTTIFLILCGTLARSSLGEAAYLTPKEFMGSFWETTFLFISGEVIGKLPSSEGGKLVDALISISGLIVFAVMVGTISASMSAYFQRKMEAKDIDISDLKNHLIICGWENMGKMILSELEAVRDVWGQGVVVVAETDEDIVGASGVENSRRLFHVKADFTNVDVLESVGARKAKTAIVLADEGNGLRPQDRDARTVLAALTLEKLNPSIFTCAELLNEGNATHLRIAGVEEVISRNTLTAGLFASSVINEGITPVVTDLMTHHEGNYLRKLSATEQFIGKPFMKVVEYYKQEYDALAIGVENKNAQGVYEQHVNPPKDRIIEKGDRLTLVVKKDSILCDLQE